MKVTQRAHVLQTGMGRELAGKSDVYFASKAATESGMVGQAVQALLDCKPDLSRKGFRAYESQTMAQLLALNLWLPKNVPFVVSDTQAHAFYSLMLRAQDCLRQAGPSLSPVPKTSGPFKLVSIALWLCAGSNTPGIGRWLPFVS